MVVLLAEDVDRNPADFGAANVTGLPTTSGGGATATSVNVMRESASKVTATVAYKATGA